MKKVLITALVVAANLTCLYAQKSVPASGGDGSGTGGSISYTVGQIDFKTYTGTGGIVNQGVQIPFEIDSVSGINEVKGISLECMVYPNPATKFIKLKIGWNKIENLTYQLYNINGVLLENKIINDKETTISMENLVPASYFLIITEQNKKVRTFKIIIN